MNKFFPYLLLALAVIQGLGDTFKTLGFDPHTQQVFGAVVLFISICLGAAKQYLDPATNNRSLWLSLSLLISAIVGGLLDNYNVFQQIGFGTEILPFLRLLVTFINLYIANGSNILFPQNTTKVFIGFLLLCSVSSCSMVKDCRLTYAQDYPIRNEICLQCDSLSLKAAQFLDSHIKIKIKTQKP